MNTERMVTEVKPEMTYAVWILEEMASRSSGVWGHGVGNLGGDELRAGIADQLQMASGMDRFLAPTIFQAGVR